MPTADVKKIKGIVIRLVDYKEADLIVTALSKEGLLSFYARGARKLTSKNQAALQSLVESEFLLSLSSQGLATLKEATPLKSFLPNDFESCIYSSLLLEILTRLIAEEDASGLYSSFRFVLEGINDGKDPLTGALMFFAEALTLAGIGLEVDSCVLCGAKNKIRTVSFTEGGYICEDCYDPESMQTYPSMYLKILRYIFKAPIEDYGRVALDKDYGLRVLKGLLDYTEEMTGVKLRSCDALLEA